MRFYRLGLSGGLLLLLALSATAMAGSTAIVGGYVIENGYASPLTGFTIQASTPQPGGGVLLGFDLANGGEAQIELGVLYMPRGFVEVLDNQSIITVSQTTLQVPLLIRFTVLPAISLGVGGFMTYALTSTRDLNSLDSGLVGSVAVKVGFEKSVSFLLDFRYQFGLTNLSTVTGFGTQFYDFQGLAGIVLGF